VDAVLEGGPELGQGHASAVELAFVSDLPWRQPDSGETVEVEELGKALGVQFIGLVGVPHHPAAFLTGLVVGRGIMTLALAACVRRGRQPAASISSAIQYQFPTVSRATGVPSGRFSRKAWMAPAGDRPGTGGRDGHPDPEWRTGNSDDGRRNPLHNETWLHLLLLCAFPPQV